eukprot:TRINITY_DN5244_c0_g1_i1.p1 TRINITY_DN5244_c0_g1~~TRINITY_DN5244_c0_g1_i1.p1  ORF type:complete len:566 (-),score=94.91 TRINITY_DN5244_c0_g1_i1:21-1718(-)
MGGGLSKKGKDQVRLSKTTGGTELNLSDCGIHAIGSFKTIARLKLLRKLDLSTNLLTTIPPNIKALANLEELDIRYNSLSTVPVEMSTLASLRVLLLGGNGIPGFPAGFMFQKLASLQVLDVSSNRMCNWPEGLAELHLISLNIGGNGLRAIPDPVYNIRTLRTLIVSDNNGLIITEKLSRLSSLEHLEMCKCNLDKLPPGIGTLSQLSHLDFRHNFVTELPDELSQLPNMRVFNAEGNQLVQFDNVDMRQWTQMEEFLLRNNKIDHLPRGIGHMQRLRVLDVGENQLTELPREVGWLDQSMRKLLAGQNRLQGIPGELSFLNPAIELDLSNNPFKPPFISWYQDGIVILMENLKPFIKGFPTNCYVYGDAMYRGEAGVPTSFSLQAVDRMGDKRLNGGDNYEAEWKGVNSAGHPFVQKGIVKDNKDGTYTVFYNHQIAGKFEVHITDSGEPIKDTPFPAYIAPAPSEAYRCDVKGDFSEGKAGVPVQCTIYAKDKFTNALDRGGENFQVRVAGPSGAAPKAVVEDTGKGIYNVTWTPGWAGEYTMQITLDGAPLNISPATVFIS